MHELLIQSLTSVSFSLSPQASLSNQPAICFKGSQGVRCFAYSPADVWEPERSNYFWFVVEHAYALEDVLYDS